MLTETLLQPGTTLRGSRSEYEILNLIGRGGMGAVYRVRRGSDGAIWALKEMRSQPNTPAEEVEENRRLFDQEAELMGILDHPNLPVLGDRFEYDNRPIMVMEYIPGKTLEDLIRDMNAPLLEQHALGYGIQLCRVLDYLHTRTPPIIYRDLKPPNIMVTTNDVLKLIDFGVARTFKERKAKDTVAMGSAGYAPPEQYGKGQTDARSDIYGLGATLLHLLTRRPPIPLQPPMPGSINRENPSVDEATEMVIIRAMSLERDQRYNDCREMEAALMACLDSEYIDPTAEITVPPVEPPVVVAPPPVARSPVAPPPIAPDNVIITPTPPPIAPPPPVSPPINGDYAPPAVAPPDPSTWHTPPLPPSSPPATGSNVCANCGAVNKARARFCASCGTPLSTADTTVARLLLRSPRATWEMQLVDDRPYHVGRRDPAQGHYPEIDLAEHDRGVASRHHARIERRGNGYTVTDTGSTNGTFLNNQRILAHTPHSLRTGDVVRVGEVEMEFRWV